MITFRGQINAKKQSRKSKILHLVWQMTRKDPKNKCFQEILQEAHIQLLIWPEIVIRKYPFIVLNCWRGSLLSFCTVVYRPQMKAFSRYFWMNYQYQYWNCEFFVHDFHNKVVVLFKIWPIPNISQIGYCFKSIREVAIMHP